MSIHRRGPVATNRQLAVRLAVSRALARTQDLDGVYSAALDTLAECLGVARASVLLFDANGVMRFKAYRGLSGPYRAAVESHSPWTPDSMGAEPFLVADVSCEPSLQSYLPLFAREEIRALGFIPLLSLGRVIGKLMLYYDAPHVFEDEEVELAVVIAAAVAFAVERGRSVELADAHEGSPRFETSAALGTWEWEDPSHLQVRPDDIPSNRLRQTNRCDLESSRDCMKILDLQGNLIFINAAGLEHLGVTDASQLLHRKFVELWPEKDRKVILDAIAAAKRGGTGRFQGACLTPGGITKWWDVVVTPIVDPTGDVVQLMAASRDVSAPWQAKAFQAGQHQVLEMIATGAPLAQVITLLVHLVQDQCEGVRCSILLEEDGVRVPDTVTDTITNDRLRPWWRTPILSQHKKVLGSFIVYRDTPRAPRADELRVLETAVDLAGVAIDQRRSQDALHQSEERNRAILRAIPDWMFVLSREGVFLDCHVKDPEALLVPPEEFLGKSMHEVLPPWLAEAHQHAFERALATNERVQFEYSLDVHSEPRFYEACIVPCDGAKLLAIVRDITDRKRAELDAASQRQELAHLNRVMILAEQSGALAHELSQPLAAVLSNAQAACRLLDREPLERDELHAALQDVIKGAKLAGAVIDRLRGLLRKGSSDLQPLDVNEITQEVLDLTRSDLLLRRIPIVTGLSPAMPPVLGDRVQLQQVIINLLLNACDSMSTVEPSEREIKVSTVVENEFVQITVADRGVGIPKDQLDSVFEPFVTHRSDGLGLGLSISRSIVIAHRGRIRAENNADRGTTFRCFLPVAAGV